MLNAELAKDIKKHPEMQYHIPKKIFTKYDVGSSQTDGLLVELCKFT